MNPFEGRVAELVREYSHLYDRSQRDFKDNTMCSNSWREISVKLGVGDPEMCKATWKNLRDKFGKAKKRMRGRSGDKRAPKLYKELAWLSPFVKLRQTQGTLHHPGEVETTGPPQGSTANDVGSEPSTEPYATTSTDTEEQCAAVCLNGFGGSLMQRSCSPSPDPLCVPAMDSRSNTPRQDAQDLQPQGRRKRRRDNTEEADFSKLFEALDKRREQHVVDCFDRYAQTVADFMRQLSRRRCAVFKKRVNDIMYEMELEELEDYPSS